MLLKGLLLTPLIGAALVGLLPGRSLGLVRSVALASAATAFGYALWIAGQFDPRFAGVQFYESQTWNPRLGSAFVLAIDGISLSMLLLGTLLSLVAVMASASIRERAKGYYMLLLILEAAMLGVFMARDWSLFYVFWELTLIPLFFLIDRWGGQNRHRAALNFVLYTLGGSVFMLVALLMLYDAVPGQGVFEMTLIRETGRALPEQMQILLFLGFLIGFGVKMPIFPLHGWLPLAHVEAPSPVSILLSGVLLKMGAYGLIRVASILPAAAEALQGLLVVLALVSLVYGGILAWRQRDLKAMIAYSSVSHMGVVLLGLASLNSAGITGAVMQMVAHGLVAGALFLLIGLLYERTHTRDIADYSSLVRVMPRFAFFTVLALVAAIGLPGTAGFIAELHALIGGFQAWGGWIVFLSLAVLISAAYALRTVGRLFTGPVSARMQGLPDLTLTELTAAAALTGGSLLIGIYPTPALELIGSSVNRLTQLFL
ncbi:NADH dehydrogenase subunit M [Sulfuritortus calidifontis]|uniref:NADH dehydrogenase subunit M n=1 Tax=Sulfuritortus calidifontis TaxID=1914471 RepID=A0A4R3JW55_9PROT|nr:NADH-quinone oxidoreductase subunit M [Sulfuritortus calidifontis]TCS72369.1 NADH dehydrogenase subunit M [Sulfuritortus calidifontis]